MSHGTTRPDESYEEVEGLLNHQKEEEKRPCTSGSRSSNDDDDADGGGYHESHESPTPTPKAEPEKQEEEVTMRERNEEASHLLVCRICFEGRDSEGEGLGKLIAPCRCRGTMKFVHTSCLKQWRIHSTRSSSALACDQCGSLYKFRQSKFVGLASNPLLLFALSVPLFLLLIWSVGFIADVSLRWSDASPLAASAPGYEQQRASRHWWSLSDEDERYVDDDDYYYYGSNPYAESRGYVRLLKTSWQHVRKGGVLGALTELAGSDEDEAELPIRGRVEAQPTKEEMERRERLRVSKDQADQKGWWSSFVWEWKYGEAGLWEGQAPALSNEVQCEEEGASQPSDSAQSRETARSQSPSGESTNLDETHEEPTTPPAQPLPKRTKSDVLLDLVDVEDKPSWLQRIAMQFSLGISLVGIVSFLNMAITLPFLQLGNFGLGRGFARMTGGTRRAARQAGRQAGGGGEGSAIATAVLLFLIFLGVMRALHVVFKGVKALARRALNRLEDVIVEWGAEDEAEEQERLRSERRVRAQQQQQQRAGAGAGRWEGWRRWLPAR